MMSNKHDFYFRKPLEFTAIAPKPLSIISEIKCNEEEKSATTSKEVKSILRLGSPNLQTENFNTENYECSADF